MKWGVRWAAGLAAAMIASCAARPFRGDTGIRPFAFDVYDVHCPSGLRVIFERAPGAVTAGVTAIVGAGARHDPEGREGLAHLVEHLAFRSHPPEADPLRIRLWALGASHNAETGHDTTTYHAFVPGESLAALVAAEGGLLLDPLAGVDEATFAVERDVVRNELRERNDTHHLFAAYTAAYAAAFPAAHPYARPAGGTHTSISALTLDDARAFATRHYRPENMTMVVVGDMDLSAVEAFVRGALPPALYGDPAHPRPIGAPPPATASAPAPPVASGLGHARAPVPTPELWIAWALPGGHGADQYVAAMWASLANQNFYWGRLGDTDVASVEMFAWPGLLGSIFICRATLTTGDHPAESLRQIEAALPWIADDDITFEYRFRFLKLSELRELAFDAESAVNRGRQRAEYAYFNGSLSAYGGMVDAVKSITVDRARDFARLYLGRDRARAVLVEPLAADARPAASGQVAQALRGVASYTPLTDATVARLARVRHLGGLRTSKLANGLDLVVLRRPGAPVITSSLAFHGGRASAPTGVAAAAYEAIDLSVEESPADYGIALRMLLEPDVSAAQVRAGADNLPRALDILSFATRSLDLDWPSDKFRETKLPFLRRSDASARERGQRAFLAALYRGHPFGDMATADQIAAPKKRDLADWIDRTVAPANAVLVIVGDVDPAEAEAAARDSFAGWHAGGGPLPPLAPALPPAAGPPPGPLAWEKSARITHQPGATQADVQIGCLLPPTDARGAAVYDVVANLASSSLRERLRENAGATYGVHAWQTTSRGGTATLQLSTAIDNARLPLAMATLREFWLVTGSRGVTAEDVREARDTEMADHLLLYETSGALADALVARWNRGWPLTSIDDEPSLFAGVRKPDVDAAFAACARNLVVAITGDEALIRAALAPPPPAAQPPAAPPPAAETPAAQPPAAETPAAQPPAAPSP